MKFVSLILILLLTVSAFSDSFDSDFQKAQSVYDEGRYAEAAALYDGLLSNGVSNIEVHYNLANACFKNDDLAKAVRHYRIAWYDAPRDPDIRANLHFALNAAGAVETEHRVLEELLFSLSKTEWVTAAVGGYVLLALLLGTALFFRSNRRLLLKVSLIPATVILLSAAGWRQWHLLELNPEWVVVKTEATTLFGPIEGSTAHYKLPMGALVRQRNIDPKGWIEVEYDEKKGWIREEYIQRVSP